MNNKFRLAILQPVFIPTLYDIFVLLQSNLAILQDVEIWSRKGRVHRAKIRTPEGTQYINIPVRTEDRSNPINEVRIDHESEWIEPILRALQYNYSNSVYYDFYAPELEADIRKAKDYKHLLPFVLYFRSRIFRFLELYDLPQFKLASELEPYDADPDLLAKTMGADIYYQEPGARHYQRQGSNRSRPAIRHPEYRQHFEGFEPGCCLLDLLFQYGPESFRIIDQLRGSRTSG
jgi:hypothetical protein